MSISPLTSTPRRAASLRTSIKPSFSKYPQPLQWLSTTASAAPSTTTKSRLASSPGSLRPPRLPSLAIPATGHHHLWRAHLGSVVYPRRTHCQRSLQVLRPARPPRESGRHAQPLGVGTQQAALASPAGGHCPARSRRQTHCQSRVSARQS